MMRRVLFAAIAVVAMAGAALAQSFPGYGPAGGLYIGQGNTAPGSWSPLTGDCTLSAGGQIICTRTNGTAFGTMAAENSNAVSITGGMINGASVTGLPAPSATTDAATKQYVDNTAVGLTPHTQARLATAAALPANTYNNGTSGVGATLTATGNAALTVDGVAVSTNDRIVVKNEATAANNGIYTVTNAGSGAAAYVLTRATDANTPGTGNANAIGLGTFVFATAGTANINTGWIVNSTVTTIGTSAINWTQFSGGGGVTSLNGLNGSLSIGAGAGATVTPSGSTVTVALNPAFLRSYIASLTLSNDSGTPNTILDIAAGVAVDSTNAVIMNVGAFTKTTAGAWTSGTGNAGMGNGLTIANNTWYHVCLANNGGTPDYWFDTAAACTNRPSGITDTKFRRIGSFRTDVSAHILAFTQNGDYFYWATKTTDHNSASLGTFTVTLTVPAGVVVTPLLGYLTSAVASTSGFTGTLTIETTGSLYAQLISDYALAANTQDVQVSSTIIGPQTNTSSQIKSVSGASGGSVSAWSEQVYTQGWIDSRGRNN